MSDRQSDMFPLRAIKLIPIKSVIGRLYYAFVE